MDTEASLSLKVGLLIIIHPVYPHIRPVGRTEFSEFVNEFWNFGSIGLHTSSEGRRIYPAGTEVIGPFVA